jgi:small subunit ribosomal protein S20
MPHTRSAKKNLRKTEKRRLHNRAVKKTLKTHIKRVLTAADGDSLDQLREEVRQATKRLDKAAAKRIVHPNLAARKKAQLARLLHGKEGAAKTAPRAK